jgi:hypothetical protein
MWIQTVILVFTLETPSERMSDEVEVFSRKEKC